MRFVFARLPIVIIAGLILAGCGVGYIARGAYEEARLIWNRKPISTQLSDSEVPPEIRDKLELVLKVRAFARDKLGLNVGGAYQTITPVDEGAIVHVVMAAPRDSLQPYTWWFPIVGRVPYRGYFEEKQAIAKAAALEKQGLDTMVRPAVAFSSLGFFDDPLLSNLLRLNRVELAGVLIHELFHRTFFLASDIMFDESAATWVGNRGAIEFFVESEGESSPDAIAARDILRSDLEFSQFLLQAQARLLDIYMGDLAMEEILKRREAAFASIKEGYARLAPSLSGLERFNLDKGPINNAVLINYLIYFHDTENFERLDQRNHGEVRKTIEQIIDLARAHPDDPFYAVWQAASETPSSAVQLTWSSDEIAAVKSSSHPPKK